MNTSSEENEALFVIVFEYGTVKSLEIRLRNVQFTKMIVNTSFVYFHIQQFLKLVYHHHSHFDDVIKIYVNESEPIILHINNWKYTFN